MRVSIITKSSPLARANRRIGEELESRRVKVSFCNPKRFALTVGANPVLTYNGQIFERPDFVLTRTGTGNHTATIIRHMEASGYDVANRIAAIQAAVDKPRTMLACAAANLPIPRTMILSGEDDRIDEWDTFPAVFKLPAGSGGAGIIMVDDPILLKAIIQMKKVVDPSRSQIMVQEYLGDRVGVDRRVFVIAGEVVGVMERCATTKGERRASLSQGGIGRAVEPTPAICEISLAVTKLLELDIAGVDLLQKGDQFVICEINSSPGLQIERHCGLNIAGRIADFVVERIRSRKVPPAG
jgi:RimK family alpha-L-glutamate ligase